METINIFKEVNCRVDKLDTLSYEQLFNMAICSPEYKGKKNAASLIDNVLRSHGFKPASTNTSKAKPDNASKGRKSTKGQNTKSRKRNSSKS